MSKRNLQTQEPLNDDIIRIWLDVRRKKYLKWVAVTAQERVRKLIEAAKARDEKNKAMLNRVLKEVWEQSPGVSIEWWSVEKVNSRDVMLDASNCNEWMNELSQDSLIELDEKIFNQLFPYRKENIFTVKSLWDEVSRLSIKQFDFLESNWYFRKIWSGWRFTNFASRWDFKSTSSWVMVSLNELLSQNYDSTWLSVMTWK